jgi:hypothetical protein
VFMEVLERMSNYTRGVPFVGALKRWLIGSNYMKLRSSGIKIARSRREL